MCSVQLRSDMSGSTDVEHSAPSSFKESETNTSDQRSITPTGMVGGLWSGVLVKSPGEQQSAGTLKIAIELPLMDLMLSETSGSAHWTNMRARTRSPQRYTKGTTEEYVRPYGSMPVQLVSRRGVLPHQYRSTLFKSVDDPSSDPGQNVTSPTGDSVSQSYLAAMTEMDNMLDNTIDWKKVEELETTIWMAQTDPKCPAFVRTNSVNSYKNILLQALLRCKRKVDALKTEANEFYGQTEGMLSGSQMQKLAHFRLLVADTTHEINLVEKMIQNAEAFIPVEDAQHQRQQKKHSLLTTPNLVRERYARQVRVICEMLLMMEELFGSVKREDDKQELQLIPNSI
ncbi:hypothetical protein T265_03470 [Opisthorchis viverrini]|uniref:Uncharacterized protein n=1 Tax=Opisthorchis viverrini TaxID=6198 RepID=A0A074ZS66_OPIVI|nr:hypothetical protein T265_03470 [Opisthorchis viverrini]KER29986.1 hypothetical protein T265_03470 [Opisthorchis viverrini]